MAKHRKPSKLARSTSAVKDVMAPALAGGVAFATVAAVAGTATVPVDQRARAEVSAEVALKAVITPGSATNWNADGIANFYGTDWSTTEYGPDVVIAPFRLVRFWQGPQNILNALNDNAGEKNIVLGSGRGAGNASWVISYLAATGDPTLTDTMWILDNNVDRPNGGYASRLPFFALVGVNPVPTPTDTGAHIVDVGYEYAWNSSVPAYVTNPVALLNSIIAYAYRYQQQDKLPLPEGALEPCDAAGCKHYIVRANGEVDIEDLPEGNTTTYVTYEAAGLPLLQPLRDWGGSVGNLIADATEPVLTVAVNAAYPNNDPLSDPSVYTPMQLVTPPDVTIRAIKQLPGAVAEGIENLQKDLGGGTSAVLKTPAIETARTESSDDVVVTAGPDSTTTAGTDKGARVLDLKPVIKPLRRDSVKFTPDKLGLPKPLDGRGPLRTIVKSVFGTEPAGDSDTKVAGDAPDTTSADED